MFSNALIVFFAASMAVAAPLRQLAPRGYIQDAELLQPYADYNNRYVALGCQDKHNSTFYDQCCHPLLKDEPLSALPGQCTPSPSATSSAAASGETLAPGDDDDDDCDDESSSVAPHSSTVAVTSAIPTSAHTHSAAPTTSVVPTSSPVPTTTKVPTTSEVPTTSVVPTTSAKPTSVKPTTTPAPSTTSTKAAAPTTTAPSNVGSSVNTGGFATFFYQGGNPGACGEYHSDSDLIVAIDEARYGNPGQKSSLCGKKVKITNTKNNKSVTATIADDCPTCRNSNSIDLSYGTFAAIAAESEGMVPISWSFI